MALGFPHISFKFKDDHQLIHTNGSGNCIDTFKTLFGHCLLESLSVIDDQHDNTSIKGFISRQLHHTKHFQYLFVNQKYISKSMIHDHIDERNSSGIYHNTDFKGKFSVFLIYIDIPWNSISLLKQDCYSYELKLVDDGFITLISNSLGINIGISAKSYQRKRRYNPSTAIRTSKNIDFESMFQSDKSPFTLSVLL